VVPCLEVEDALAAAGKFPREQVVLGGERGGLPIEGFDLGNSPAEYTPASVGGKTVVFTTTNGTSALERARQAKHVYVAAFVNAAAVVRALTNETDVHLLCAGTRGEITREDVLLAGLLVERLLIAYSSHGCLGSIRESSSAIAPSRETTLNDQAMLALAAWQDSETPGPTLSEQLRQSNGGRNLARIGLARDIDDAAKVDRFDFVPVLDASTWSVTIPPASGVA
jgi:2-phosphosulfolactate phosphatase